LRTEVDLLNNYKVLYEKTKEHFDLVENSLDEIS
jgi:hypothetical protein